jgi:predicted nucleic acid-binding protein
VIAVDTNVLVRLLNDEPAQALRERNLFDRAAAQQGVTTLRPSIAV